MNYFAITPERITPDELTARLPQLNEQTVRFLYLRAAPLHAHLAQLVPAVAASGITPIIPQRHYRAAFGTGCGIHARSSEQLSTDAGTTHLLKTASCHAAIEARALLDGAADYVFLSPVSPPLSKPDDRRPVIAHAELEQVVNRYGERVVLLGGMTPQRITDLQHSLQADFSAAGISMFFACGKKHSGN